MPSIRESAIDDLTATLSDWRPFEPNADTDLFIGAIGFEDRSSICFKKWCEAGHSTHRKAILIEYPMNCEDNQRSAIQFEAASKNAGIDITIIRYNRLTLYALVLNAISSLSRCKSILIDLSSMASFVFYPTISAVCETRASTLLSVCYTEAEDYFPTKVEWQEFQDKMKDLDLLERARLFDQSHFQSDGVDVAYEALNFEGRNIDNFPTKLIVVPNFSFERVNRMIDYAVSRYNVQRSDCDWIIGMPPDANKNGWRYEALWEMFNKPNNTKEASTLNYKDMLLTLHQIWEQKFLSHSLIIATVGSKSQHLGTFFFLLMHPEVGLELSEPKQFTASRYSSKAGAQWLVEFGPVDALVSKLNGWNQIKFGW